jgi:alkylhydroperoxidase family enzyme
VTQAEIDAIGHPDRWPEVFGSAERAVLALADAISGGATHALAPDLVTELREHYSEAARAELILVAGQANLNNRAGNAAKQLLGPET